MKVGQVGSGITFVIITNIKRPTTILVDVEEQKLNCITDSSVLRLADLRTSQVEVEGYLDVCYRT